MSAPFPSSWAVTACTCGCGTVALHFEAGGMPAIRIVLPSAAANEMAVQIACAAEVAAGSRNESRETVDSGLSEARH